MKDPISSNYAYCFNNQCVHGSQCLRYLAGENCSSQDITVRIINPKCIPADTSDCPYFNSARKVRMAWGIKNLLDTVPYKLGYSMRQQLIGHFGRTTYYRIYRQERALPPKEQEYIRQLFREKGIKEEPKFERYTDEYCYD